MLETSKAFRYNKINLYFVCNNPEGYYNGLSAGNQ